MTSTPHNNHVKADTSHTHKYHTANKRRHQKF